MSKSYSILIKSSDDAVKAMPSILELMIKGLAGGFVVLTFGREKRSDIQNNKMWAMCSDISKQVVWHGLKLTSEDWKILISAEVEGQRILPGIGGQFVVMSVGTRRQNKKWFSDFFEAAHSFGAEKGVIWSEVTKGEYDE